MKTRSKRELLREIEKLQEQLSETKMALHDVPNGQTHTVAGDLDECKQVRDPHHLLAAIRQENELLSALINSIDDEVWFADPKKRFILMNTAAVKEFGLNRSESIEVERLAASLEVYRPDGSLRPVEEAPPLRALKGEAVKNLEEIIRLPARGELRHRQVSAAPVRDRSGNILGSVAVVRDITECKRNEQALKDAHEQMRWLARFPEDNPNPVARVSADGSILYRNTATAELPGWAWRIGEAVAGSFSVLIEQAMAEARVNQEDMELGGRFYSVSLVPFPSEGYVNVYGIDITNRKRAEEEAVNRAAQLQATFEAMNDAVLIYDTGMNVLRVNPSFLASYGFDPVGLNLREIIRRVSCHHLDGRPLVLEDQPTPLALRGEKVAGAHFLVTRPDGSNAVIETSSGPIRVADLIIGSVTVWHDITEAKQAEEALRESELFLRESQKIARLGGWMANPFTDYLNWTDGVYEIIEAPRDYAPGLEEGIKFFLPQYIPILKERLENCLATGEPFTLECEVCTTEGKTLWTEVRGLAPVVKGERTCVMGTFQDITARRQAEQAVRDSEARFRLLSETAGRLLAAEDPQDIVNDLCRAVMEYLDCQTCFHFLVEEESGRLHLSACTGISQEEACKIEWLDYGMAISGCVARDGVRIVVDDILNVPDSHTELVRSYGIQAYACHPLIAGGRVLGTLSFGTRTRSHFSPQDLALMKTVVDQVATAMDRKRLLRELNKSREELENRVRERTGELLMANLALQEQASLLDLAHDAIIVRDSRDRIVYWNRGAESTYGWPRDEALGKVVYDFLQTQSAKPLDEIRTCLMEEGKWEGELCHTTRNGSLMIVASRQALQRNVDGKPTGILEINRDITRHKRAEEEISQARAMLQMVFDGISDPLFMLAQDMTVKMLNQAAHRYFQVSSNHEVIGRSCYDLSDGKCSFCEDCEIQKAILKGKSITFERRGLFDPASIEQVTVYPLDDSVGGISGAIVGITDITESRKLEEHMIRVDRLSSLGQLSAGIAHEIRNPLAGINLFVDVLTDEEKFQRTGQELEILGEIKRNIKKMDGIIKRILDFARQSESPILDKLDVSLLISDTLKLWRSAMTKAGIVLHLSVAEDLPHLRGDAIELQQVLNNLLENAVDAMGRGGHLRITARQGVFSLDEHRQAVILTLQDTGPGIPVEHRGSIFNPFFTTKPAGTGLGLAISHRIVSRHGGTIFCESTTDMGTTFRIEFPIASGE